MNILDQGNQYGLVAVCAFTKYVEGAALPNKTAETVAKAIFFNVLCRWGAVPIEVHDGGGEFCNQIQDRLHGAFGVDVRVSSPFHPQANGIAGMNVT